MLGQDGPLIAVSRARRPRMAGIGVALVGLLLLGGCGWSTTPAPTTSPSLEGSGSSAATGPSDTGPSGSVSSGTDSSGTDSSGTPEAPIQADGSGAPDTGDPRAIRAPRVDTCSRLTFAQAIAPTAALRGSSCRRPGITARTFAVGRLQSLRQGHLLAVDSSAIQDQVAKACPQRLRRYLGGSEDTHRLSMLRAVWFTPTVAESAAGADWYRCDVVALAADGRLARLRGPLRGLLDDERAAAYALCATAAPDDPKFRRVICSADHTWRALSVVRLPRGDYPGIARVRRAGPECEDVARGQATDALDFRWGYEWPTPAQWRAGRTYGVCWAPADGS